MCTFRILYSVCILCEHCLIILLQMFILVDCVFKGYLYSFLFNIVMIILWHFNINPYWLKKHNFSHLSVKFQLIGQKLIIDFIKSSYIGFVILYESKNLNLFDNIKKALSNVGIDENILNVFLPTPKKRIFCLLLRICSNSHYLI